ncbi:MAG TPA: hypothetical protein DDW71_02565 [Lactobacillus sp.]|nr:hypothetical protein [Lactobacillus sp.]
MINTQFRDLTLTPITAEETLVIACDSSAGIGEKKADVVAIDPAITAAYSLRVPLLELMCFGAHPITVIDTVGNEMVPTGERIISGVKAELARAQLSDIPLNGSTEDNMATLTTSIGITVIGRIQTANIPKPATVDLTVFKLGTPYVGNEVVAHLNQIFSYDKVRQIRGNTDVVDMLPVGSKGVTYELDQMAQTNHLETHYLVDHDLPELNTSAGPATVVLVGVKKTRAKAVSQAFPELVAVAELRRPKL